MAVGSITINNALTANGNAIVPSAGTTIKVLFYGITANSTNVVLTLSTVVGGAELILQGAKSSGANGVIGCVVGDSADSNSVSTVMCPLFLDETLSLRMSGSLASAGDLCSVAYVEVQ